jgi:peptide/nickel transport system substrate-binding protein
MAYDDYITFTFKLRDDVKFHNGDPFTAEDVIFTIENGKATPSSPTYSTWKGSKPQRRQIRTPLKLFWTNCMSIFTFSIETAVRHTEPKLI